MPAQNLAQRPAGQDQARAALATDGSSIHLAMELFNSMNGIKMLHVPYKGSAPAITNLIGGQVNVLFDPISTLYPQVKGGKVRGLAVTTAGRSPTAAELPHGQRKRYAGLRRELLASAGGARRHAARRH